MMFLRLGEERQRRDAVNKARTTSVLLLDDLTIDEWACTWAKSDSPRATFTISKYVSDEPNNVPSSDLTPAADGGSR